MGKLKGWRETQSGGASGRPWLPLEGAVKPHEKTTGYEARGGAGRPIRCPRLPTGGFEQQIAASVAPFAPSKSRATGRRLGFSCSHATVIPASTTAAERKDVTFPDPAGYLLPAGFFSRSRSTLMSNAVPSSGVLGPALANSSQCEFNRTWNATVPSASTM